MNIIRYFYYGLLRTASQLPLPLHCRGLLLYDHCVIYPLCLLNIWKFIKIIEMWKSKHGSSSNPLAISKLTLYVRLVNHLGDLCDYSDILANVTFPVWVGTYICLLRNKGTSGAVQRDYARSTMSLRLAPLKSLSLSWFNHVISFSPWVRWTPSAATSRQRGLQSRN
jgi:hypothetical protein